MGRNFGIGTLGRWPGSDCKGSAARLEPPSGTPRARASLSSPVVRMGMGERGPDGSRRRGGAGPHNGGLYPGEPSEAAAGCLRASSWHSVAVANASCVRLPSDMGSRGGAIAEESRTSQPLRH